MMTISHSKVIFTDWSEELRTSRLVQIQDWLSPEARRSVAQHRGRWAVKSDFVEGLENTEHLGYHKKRLLGCMRRGCMLRPADQEEALCFLGVGLE